LCQRKLRNPKDFFESFEKMERFWPGMLGLGLGLALRPENCGLGLGFGLSSHGLGLGLDT